MGLAPKIDNKTMCWRENRQLSAAPASRRLGRAGLEAPPLLGGMRETGTQEQNLKCRRGHVLRGWVTSAFRW